MSFDDAVSALTAAASADEAGSAPEQAPTPAVAAPEGTTETPQVQPTTDTRPRDPISGRFIGPEETVADAPTVEDTFDGGQFNPDTLPPELQAGWKQLQAAFTQKTQEVAAQRAQYEQLGDLNQVQEAVQLYHQLQDPSYLQAFHSELSAALESRGLTPAQASVEAARQIESGTPSPDAAGDPLAALRDDPELAPLAKLLEQQQAELASFKSERQAEREAQESAHFQMALAGEIQRQDMAVRQTNPGYRDADMDMVYELSAFHDGNLIQSQQRLEDYVQGRLAAYLDGKTAVLDETGVTLPGAGATSDVPVKPQSLDEAQVAALEYLNAQGIDHIGD